MKRSVKFLVIIPLLGCLPLLLSAQIRLTAQSRFAEDVRTLLADYPAHFARYIGDEIMRNPQSTDYRCLLPLKDAEQCFFTRYPAHLERVSWEAVMLTTEEFEQAEKKFRTVFQQLNPLQQKLSDGRILKLKGDYTKPDASLKFNSAILSPAGSSPGLDRLRLEILLTASGPLEWQVKLLVYEKEREDEERGAVREEGEQ